MRFINKFRWLWFICLFVSFLFLGGRDVLAQQVSVGNCNGNVLGDIWLSSGWHHRGTVKGVTSVGAGFIFPGGGYISPDWIYFGDGTGWQFGSTGSHNWANAGSYTIKILKYMDCGSGYEVFSFSRQIWVANSSVALGGYSMDESSASITVSPGGVICGLGGVFSQGGNGGLTSFTIDGAPATWANAYIGQPGGAPFGAGFVSSFDPSGSRVLENKYINYYQAGRSQNSVTFDLSTVGTAYWDLFTINAYLNCAGPGPPPPPSPSPFPPDCPVFYPGVCRLDWPTPEIKMEWDAVEGAETYKMYRDDVYQGWNGTFTSYSDQVSVLCGGHLYDVKPVAGGVARNCQQNYVRNCPCPTNTPTPTPTNTPIPTNTPTNTPTPTPTCAPVCNSPLCGQADSCGSVCSSVDDGVPAGSVIVSPDGTAVNPDFIVSTDNVNLVWQQNSSILTDEYHVEIYQVGVVGEIRSVIVGGRSNVSANSLALEYGPIYYWRIRAVNTTCEGNDYGSWSALGYFKFGRLPSYDSFLLRNSVPTNVVVETGNRNHLCQTEFLDSRQVIFRVVASDPDGGDGIDEVQFRLRRSGYNSLLVTASGMATGAPVTVLTSDASFWGSGVTTSVNGDDRTVDFYIEFPEVFYSLLTDMQTYIIDEDGLAVGWVDVARDFKVWDCEISVSGDLYDGSMASLGSICPLSGYDDLADAGMNFTSLIYQGLGVGDEDMTVVSPGYSDGGNELVWGESYTPVFNADLSGSIPVMRIIDTGSAGVGTTSCAGLVALNDVTLSAYSNPPALDIDFSSVMNQDPWFQVVGAGIGARVGVVNNIPYTCVVDAGCQAATTTEVTGEANNGLVAVGISIDNNSGCAENDCKYGDPNNWSLENNNIIAENCLYQDFYNRFYTILGEGVGYSGNQNMSTIVAAVGGTGVVFVNGNVNVDVDNTVSVGEFLMVVSSGVITIDSGVDQVEGVLVADNGIAAGGDSDNQLEINGTMCSANGNISLTRDYSNGVDNNTAAATEVNYRPDLLFAMPGILTEVLSGWREGY